MNDRVKGTIILIAIIAFLVGIYAVGVASRNACLERKCPNGMMPQKLYGGECICAVVPE